MTTATTRSSPATAGRSARRRPGLAVFAALNAASAWGGAVALTAGFVDFGDRLNRRLPFASPVLAGIALAVIVALPSSLLAWQAWNGDRRVDRVAIVTGILLVAWIAVQLVFLRAFSAFQPAYAAIGAALIVAGRRHLRGIPPHAP